MPRLIPLLLVCLLYFTIACKKEVEPEGQLEGEWVVRGVLPIEYDPQNKVLSAYPVQPPSTAGYTLLRISPTELHHADEQGPLPSVSYERTGDQVTCPAPYPSYTIRKLTAQTLELHLRGEYIQSGPINRRTDFTIYLDRQ